MKGVAFKATYNDGGAHGGLVGYRGVCSDPVIVDNVHVRGMTWCSQPNNPCRQHFDGGLEGLRPRVRTGPDAFCYESGLFLRQPRRFGGGFFHTGEREGEPIPVAQVEVGDVAILTTIPPGGGQEDRFIFGLFRIGQFYLDNDWGYVSESDGSMDVVIPDDVARDLLYWNYQHPNADGTRMWGSGLVRYLDEDLNLRFIEDLLWRLGDDPARDVIVGALEHLVQPRPHRGLLGGGRGHGRRGGGEGEAHRELKHLVAAHPERIGLPPDAVATIEHRYLSGDRVDVKFDLPDGNAAVVEIETICPLPGAHQAVKYRALLEVERGEALNAGNVEAVLVAHGFDQESVALAQQYGIRLVAMRA